MNGSPSAVLSAGFGSWGSTGLVLTLGLGILDTLLQVVPSARLLTDVTCSDSVVTSVYNSATLVTDVAT